MESYDFGMDLSMYNSGELFDIKKKLMVECELIQNKIDEIDASLYNHIYLNIESAECALMEKFRDMAFDDCEGAGNCGDDEYTQKFIVDGKIYLGTGLFQYNRHDKTYYYIDDSNWSCKIIG